MKSGTKHRLRWIAWTLGVLILVGCGGHHTPQPTTQETAVVELDIAWPKTRVIPPETQRIEIWVSGTGIASPLTKSFRRPTASGGSGRSEFTVPAGPQRLFGAAAFDGAGNCVAFGTAMVNLTPGERKGLVIEMQLTPSGPAPVGGARTPEEVGWIYGAQVVPASDNPLLASASLALRGEGTSALTDSQIVVQQVIAGRFVVNTAPLNFSGGGGSSRKIDVAFVLDTTGSMGEEIAGVRDSVIEFATTLEGSGNDIRVAALTFGDEIRETYDFTSSYEDFRDFIAGLYAEGGGDGPELGLDAVIEASRSLSWRADTERIIIVITDATAHQRGDGTSFSNVIAEEVVNALRTQYTVHVVSSVFPMRSRSSQQGISSELMDSNQRSRSTTTPYDMRNLAPQLGGVWIALPTSGIVDLTELGITELVQNTYRFKFLRALWFDASDAPAIFVNIRREDGWIRIPLGVRFTP